MKKAGIIVEYNPFHNGHLYHLNQTKALSQADVVIAVMSGNFTERGDVAVIDKHLRTELALKAGVDIVIELPYLYSVANADLFSFGAISLLNYCGVDEIIFGSELNDPEHLTVSAALLDHPTFDDLIKDYLNEGYSYPKAASLALKDLGAKNNEHLANDILGIQYIRQIKRINPKITYQTVKRLDNNYHDEEILHGKLASATAIRTALKNHRDVSGVVPVYTLDALNSNPLHFWDDYFTYLKYMIIASETSLKDIHDLPESLEKAIVNNIQDCGSINELAERLISKRYTKGRVMRSLVHILTNTTKPRVQDYDIKSGPKSLRILGFRKDKATIIQDLKKTCPVPIITNITRNTHELLKIDLQASSIYHLPFKTRERKIPIIL